MNALQSLLLVTLLSFSFTVFIICWLLKSNLAKLAIDIPNHRSLHTTPVPRTGGLAIMIVTFIPIAISGLQASILLVFCILFLMILSLADDFYGLPAGLRFLGHFAVTGVFIGLALPSFSLLLMLAIAVLVVWMTNLFNFMDGSDGLAGGMALMGFGTYAIAAWLSGNNQLVIICSSLAASSSAFLIYNFEPARIFMGDSGSIPLGFLAATMGLMGLHQGVWPLWFPFLVFSPFIIDATVTLIKRILHAEIIWQAHRSHYYQRLVLMGWEHRRVALAEYLLMIILNISAIWMMVKPVKFQITGLSAWGLIYIVLAVWIDLVWRKHLKMLQGVSTTSI